ncbi:MAG: Nucleotidyltransferase substrate binding protein, HI0074 family [candidate division TM6 bacterium GW2011_GWF2_38_10]|nr:MAG: Nucleotidyltransferase substrate binding protein, HI0074 family [candidate division TM6 bacterium GW2011_GWF2_38_10]
MVIDKKISLTALIKAKNQLAYAIKNAKSELEITGAIKCFEYCYELSWKTMKKILESMGLVDINSPRTVFIEAFKNQLIDNLSVWNSFITQRNLTFHTYDEEIALEVFDSLPQFLDHLVKFIEHIQNKQ